MEEKNKQMPEVDKITPSEEISNAYYYRSFLAKILQKKNISTKIRRNKEITSQPQKSY